MDYLFIYLMIVYSWASVQLLYFAKLPALVILSLFIYTRWIPYQLWEKDTTVCHLENDLREKNIINLPFLLFTCTLMCKYAIELYII